MTTEHQRDVARVDSPQVGRGMTDEHLVRPLVPPDDFAASDPFLLLMEDTFPLGVFDRHPHQGIETVTYVIDGAVEHFDNHGNTGLFGAGDALWLTSGRGIVHNEQPARGEPVHLLQLWVNLPAASKRLPANFQELRAADLPVRREPGAEIRVFSGSSGTVTAPTTNHAAVTMVEARLEPGASIEQDLPADYTAFVVVLEGSGSIGMSRTKVTASEVAWLTKGDDQSAVRLTGGAEGLRAILFAGRPIGEPIAARGPFVLNTDAELDAGFREYRRSGERFGLEG